MMTRATKRKLELSPDYVLPEDSKSSLPVKKEAKLFEAMHTSSLFQPRNMYKEDPNVIGIIDEESKTIQTFNPRDKSWNVLHNITEEIIGKRFFAIAVDQVIFVLADDRSNYKFNLSKPTEGWIKLPRRSKSGDVQVVEINGELYAFNNNGKPSVTIEILDTDHTSWRKMEKPKCREEAITAAKGHIYTFGGYYGSHLQRSMKFDPNTNSWMNLPDMPTARSAAAATTLDDRIYVIGGSDERRYHPTTECFDIATQKWTILKQMNTSHVFFNAYAFDGKIYAVDGYIVLGGEFMIEEYDPATDTWEVVIEDSDKWMPSKATVALRT